jgi:alpha-N-acetylglucosamine transferase
MSNRRFAYAFYATDDQYAVAVLVAAKLIRQFSSRQDIDFVVLHLNVSGYLLAMMRGISMITKSVEALPPVYHDYYRHCLLKLRTMQLLQYDRVVFLDSDAIPLKSLDSLFELPFTGSVAAPTAYWLRQPFVTTLLLVIKPSSLVWNRVVRHFDTAYEMNYYDMDIVNVEFRDEMCYLPATVACLNSEWEPADGPFYFGDPEKRFREVKVVHFTALGKPWFYEPTEVKQLRPSAHPRFYWLWERWWLERDTIIQDAPLLTKLRLLHLAHAGKRHKGKETRSLLNTLMRWR